MPFSAGCAAPGPSLSVIDDVNAGRTVFYDIYTDAVMDAEPSRRNTGMFFFRGKPGAPFAVIAPGGGFAYVGSLHEGFPYAAEISNRGYNAFVLKYRAGQGGGSATEAWRPRGRGRRPLLGTTHQPGPDHSR